NPPAIIAFFNNKGGVGKTSLVYHVAWMLSDLGIRCLAVDLDPQSNLTAAMLDESKVEELWDGNTDSALTMYDAVLPIIQGVGDIAPVAPLGLDNKLNLLPGDLRLSGFEDKLSSEWPRASDRHEDAYRVLTSFYRTVRNTAELCSAELVLMDVGPNLGAL